MRKIKEYTFDECAKKEMDYIVISYFQKDERNDILKFVKDFGYKQTNFIIINNVIENGHILAIEYNIRLSYGR